VRADLVSIIEAAYRLDQHESVWLRGLREAILPTVNTPMGAISVTYRLGSGRIVGRCVDVHGARGAKPVLDLIAAGRPAAFIRPWLGTVVAFGSELSDHGETMRVGAELGFDFREGFGLHAGDPTGAGVVIAVPLHPGKRAKEFANHTLWERIAAHVASGFRAHRALASVTLEGEAVLDPGGRVLHAHGPAAEKAARVLLRSACQTVDHARTGKGRGDPDAIQRWTSLFGARWSLVDRFDRDGRRYVVAVRNMLADGSQPLTAREAQVVGLVALGHTNKLIAYELGLAWSTVRVLVQRAARKLDVRTRAELEVRARELRLEMPRGLDGDPVPHPTDPEAHSPRM
jgi:DNA-binding CsgD family transcriptional regulator